MFEHYALSIILASVATLCSMALILLKPRRLVNIAVATAIALSGIAVYTSINDYYGKPKVLLGTKAMDVTVVSHIPGKDKKYIYLWVITKNSTYPTSYRVPFSQKLADALNKNRKAMRGRPYKAKMGFKKIGGINPYADGNMQIKRTGPSMAK